MSEPFFNNVATVGLDDPEEVPQDGRGDLGVVIAQQSVPSAGDPYLCAVRYRPSLCNVDVGRFQGVIFIGAKLDDIGPDPKNLRH